MNSPIVYYGGKKSIADKIVGRFPRGPTCYVEPMVGGCGVFASVPVDVYPVRVINDLNASLVTFYRVLRTRPQELARVCSLTPYALDEQRLCRDPSQDPKDDELEVARRVWVRQNQNFGGRQGPSAGWKRGDAVKSVSAETARKIEALEAFARFLLPVEINCKDAVELISDYARPGVFLYEDPPYYPESRATNNDYGEEMPAEVHEKLAVANHAAAAAGALVMISNYGCEFYERAYAGWRREEFEHGVSSTNFASAEARARTEVVWMNYPASIELQNAWNRMPRPKTARERALLKAFR
jgi:DNA adenine methylase